MADYSKKLFTSFSSGAAEGKLYPKLRKTLDLSFLYKDTGGFYGKTGNPSIDHVVFSKLLHTGK